MRLVLHRLGFVIYDTEDEQAVYTVFEVLNSRGLDVNSLDKAKSMLMGKAFEMRKSKEAGEGAIKELQNLWGQIYRELAREDVSSDELLRVTATLHFGPGAGKVRSDKDSLKEFSDKCDTIDEPRQFSEWLLDCAKKLTLLLQQRLGPVIDILHARLLAVAIMSAKGVDERERKTLMDQWERVTFRVFGFNGLDARRLVGEYARLGSDIMKCDQNKEFKPLTYNEIMPRLMVLGAKYPIAEAVQTALAREDWYDDPELCRYVLWQYEEHLAEKAGSGATVNVHDRDAIWKTNASDSIEHIFPQSKSSPQGWIGKMCREGQSEEPLDKHVGRIGNLVLLPKKLNSKASTKSFAGKKVEYAKHGLRTMQWVRSQDDWTLDQIEAREAEIMNWAMARWADL